MFVRQVSPTLPSRYVSVRKGAAWMSAVILSDGEKSSDSCHADFFPLQQGMVQPVRPQPSLSSTVLWDRSVCSTIRIGARNSLQNLGLLLISFVLALPGLALQRPFKASFKAKDWEANTQGVVLLRRCSVFDFFLTESCLSKLN